MLPDASSSALQLLFSELRPSIGWKQRNRIVALRRERWMRLCKNEPNWTGSTAANIAIVDMSRSGWLAGWLADR